MFAASVHSLLCGVCCCVITSWSHFHFLRQKLEQVTKFSGECIIVGVGEEEFFFSLFMKIAETFALMQQLTYLATKE